MIASGYIRGSDLEIAITGDAEGSESITVVLKGVEDQARLVISLHHDFLEVEEGRRVFRLPLSKVPRPLVSVDLRVDGRSLDKALDWCLAALYPRTADQFQTMFYRSKHRIKDLETQMFSAFQVFEHYRLDVSHESVAAVIAAYRLIDTGDKAGLAHWTVQAQHLLPRLQSAPRTHFPRSDRDHQAGSLLTALWLVLLAQGRFVEMLQTLDTYVAMIESFDDEVSPSVILNGCLSILMRGYLAHRLGDTQDALRLYSFNHGFYVRYLPRMEPHAIWFKEMRFAHDAVALSLDARERMGAGKKGLDSLIVVRACHRVNSVSGKVLLEAQFASLCRKLRGRARSAKGLSEAEAVVGEQ